MKEKEKSLELAKLMKWDVVTLNGDSDWYVVLEAILKLDEYPVLEPYSPRGEGLAQFGAILLQFPEVFEYASGGGFIQCKDVYIRPTQESILDGILMMNGVTI